MPLKATHASVLARIARGDSPIDARATGLMVLGIVTLMVATALWLLPFKGAWPAVAALGICGGVGWCIHARLKAHHPHARLGWGTVVTIARAGGVAIFAALALQPQVLWGAAVWIALAAAILLLTLDGLDGMLARRQGLISPFGARLDMEIDALLILALSALALGLDKAGVWILCLGLMRYAFVAAGLAVPALARPLPPSWRRKAVCVVQVCALSLLLAPWLLPPVSSAIGLAALAALVWSFGIDTARLFARR